MQVIIPIKVFNSENEKEAYKGTGLIEDGATYKYE